MADRIRIGVRSGNDLEIWHLIDGLDFDHMWTDDHLITLRDEQAPVFDSWSLMAAMAIATKRVRIGVLVTCNLYRHPSVLAKQAVTVDHLSGGRLEVGIGACWNEAVLNALGVPFYPVGERMDRLEEACRVMKALWTEPRASFGGRYYQLTDAVAEPKPLQRPHPPLWIGGSGPTRTLRIAARYADVWNTGGGGFDADMAAVSILERHCAEVGRDPKQIRRAVELSWLKETADANLALAERYVKAGFTEFCFGMGRGEAIRKMTRDEARRRIEDFAGDGVGRIRQLG